MVDLDFSFLSLTMSILRISKKNVSLHDER